MHSSDLAEAMKLGMRRLASGVCVLSTEAEEVGRFAMTATSVTSVSDTPPSLLVCINRNIALHEHLTTPGCGFAVNLLDADQREVSNLCAGFNGDVDRFSLGQWAPGHDNLPYLADAQAAFFCRADQVTDYGSHRIVIARIEAVEVGELTVDPLVYVDGGYARLTRD